jgi:hypothetical protein
VNTFSEDNATRLLELIGQELELFGRIRELSQDQAELIAQDEIEALNISLDRRQECIDKINGLHQETNVLMQSYMASVGTDGSKKSEEAESAIRRLRDAVSGCVALNEKIMADAQEKAKSYAGRIDELSTGRKGLDSYIHQVPNNPELFDKMT